MRRALPGWIGLVGPILVVAVFSGLVLRARFEAYDGNPTGFVLFSHYFAPQTHPPRGAVIKTEFGYDGQFYYLQAKDPFLVHDATVSLFRGIGEDFRLQRLGYPALAYLFAGGQRAALPWSLLILNVALVLAITGGFAAYARRQGWSGWWSLPVGLATGLWAGMVRDLSDPLAGASVLAGMMLWRSGRRWWAAVLLTLAVLTREPAVLAVAAVAVDAVVRGWRGRRQPGAIARAARHAWPAVLLPALAFAAWHLYLDQRFGGNVLSPSSAFHPPFVGMVNAVRNALSDQWADAVWELAYIGLICAAVGAAIGLARRKVNAGTLAVLVFALSILVLNWSVDPWGYTRDAAPMFVLLVPAALDQRRGWILGLCALGAGLTLAAPLAPWFGAV